MQNKKLTVSLVASFFLATNLLSNELFISSATKSEQSIKDVTSNVEVITADDIEEKNYTNITEVLNSVSGLSFVSNGGMGTQSTMFLRGIESKRILFLIDGVRYNDHGNANGAPIEHLNVDNIEKIEVIKGAQSGIWGADASAGVVNIITKNAKNGFKGNITTELGSFKTKKLNSSLSYGGKKLDLVATYSNIKSNGFSAYSSYGTNINDYEDDSYSNESYSLKSAFKLNDENKLTLFYKNIDSLSDLDSSSSDKLTAYTDYNTDISTINFENKTKNVTTTLHYNYSDFDRKYYSGTSFSDYESDLNEFGIKSKIQYFNDKSFVLVGADSKTFDVKLPITNKYKNDALFITNSNRFDSTVLTQSLRYDKYNKFDNKLTGKFGIKQDFNKDLYVSSNISSGYNVPTMYQLFHATYGDANLTPETTKSVDLTLGYKQTKLTIFRSEISDMIDYSRTLSKYENVDGKSKFKGLEFSYKKDILKDLFMSLNYTHLSAVNGDDEVLRRRPKDQVDMGFDFYGIKNTHININGSYIGTRYDDDDKQDRQTGRYTVWNSVVNYDINKNLKTYLKIDNLFDKYYQTVDGYSTSPRAFYVGLKATF